MKKTLVLMTPFAVILTFCLTVFKGNPTGFFFINKSIAEKNSTSYPENLLTLENGGYDGQFYYFHAMNPAQPGAEVPPGYRVRLLQPYLVYGLWSITGKSVPLSWVYVIFSFFAVTLGAFVYLKLAQLHGVPWSLGLIFFYANIGLLTAFKLQLSECVAVPLFLSSLFFIKKEMYIASTFAISLCLLARDAFVFPTMGIVLYFFTQRRFWPAIMHVAAVAPIVLMRKIWSVPSSEKWVAFDSFFEFGATNPREVILNFPALLYFFIVMILVCKYLVKYLHTPQKISPGEIVYPVIFSTLFLGLFNPTSAWSNVTGVMRHAVLTMTLTPFLPIQKKALTLLSLLLGLIFFLWMITDLGRVFISLE